MLKCDSFVKFYFMLLRTNLFLCWHFKMPPYACICTDQIEQKFLETQSKKPLIWLKIDFFFWTCRLYLLYLDSWWTGTRKIFEGFFFNWDLFHARLNSHDKAWNYRRKKQKKIKPYRKSVYKKKCLLILDVKTFGSEVKGKHSIGREFQSPAVRVKKLLARHPCNI